MVLEIRLIQGEGKTKTFIIKKNDEAIDLTEYANRSYSFIIKEEKGEEDIIIEKTNSDFITDEEDDGKIKVNFNATETKIDPKTYYGQLKVQLDNLSPSKNLDKSQVIDFVIEQEV